MRTCRQGEETARSFPAISQKNRPFPQKIGRFPNRPKSAQIKPFRDSLGQFGLFLFSRVPSSAFPIFPGVAKFGFPGSEVKPENGKNSDHRGAISGDNPRPRSYALSLGLHFGRFRATGEGGHGGQTGGGRRSLQCLQCLQSDEASKGPMFRNSRDIRRQIVAQLGGAPIF